MYGKFLYFLGIAFTLFIVIMFIGALFRSGFSGILKFFFSRLLMIIFVVTVCLAIGIIIYSLLTTTAPIDTFNLLWASLKEEISKL